MERGEKVNFQSPPSLTRIFNFYHGHVCPLFSPFPLSVSFPPDIFVLLSITLSGSSEKVSKSRKPYHAHEHSNLAGFIDIALFVSRRKCLLPTPLPGGTHITLTSNNTHDLWHDTVLYYILGSAFFSSRYKQLLHQPILSSNQNLKNKMDHNANKGCIGQHLCAPHWKI